MRTLNGLQRIERLSGGRTGRSAGNTAEGFENHLREACSRHGVRLTGHAGRRMVSRKLEVSEQEVEKISEAMKNVEAKGGGKSAIFMDGKVFLADIRNRSIITAIEQDKEGERVFTGIDSAVFV